jgi:hypothetical protein
VTEQEATDRLEELAGGVDKSFKLMRIYQSARQSMDMRFHGRLRSRPSVEQVFYEKASRDGYTRDAVEHYLKFIR